MGIFHYVKILLPVLVLFFSGGFLSALQAQDVIRASGGTNQSVDRIGGEFYTLSGPTIRETETNQLQENGLIVLTLPAGYEWNTGLTVMPDAGQGDEGTEDITFTIESVGAQNTDLEVSFESLNSQEFTFRITQTSRAAGAGKGPARLTINGLQIRPTDTNVPDQATITNTGTTGPTEANYGNLSKAAGSIAEVSIETASDGSGELVQDQNLPAGNSITVYSIARDVGGNFIENISLDDESDWRLTDITGNISPAALVPSSSLTSAVFSSQATGSARILAEYQDSDSVPSGVITVQPRSVRTMQIRTQPSPNAVAGVPFDTQPVIELLDQFGNIVTTNSTTEISVYIESGSGTLLGTTTQTADQGIVTFDDLYSETAETITLRFEGLELSSIFSNEIEISPNDPVDLVYLQQPTNTAQNSTISPPVEIQLLDLYGNMVAQSGISVTISSEDNLFHQQAVLSANTNSEGIAEFSNIRIRQQAPVGPTELEATFPGIIENVTSHPFDIISSGDLARFEITAPDGSDLSEKIAGVPFTIRVAAIDGNGDVFEAFEDDVEITADSEILIDGNTVSGFTTDEFIQGEVEAEITLISAGSGRIYADNPSEDRDGRSNLFSVIPADVDFSKTGITAHPSQLIADGESTSLITVQLKDEYENNLISGGETITLETTAGTLSAGTDEGQSSVTADDNDDGTYTATLTSSEDVGTATLTASEEDNTIATAMVDFVPGEVTAFTIQVPADDGVPIDQVAGEPFGIDIEAVDDNGNRVVGYNGSLNLSTNSTFQSGNSITLENGFIENHQVVLTRSGEDIMILAEDPEIFGIQGTSDSFTVLAADPDLDYSQVTVNPDVIQNDGTSQSVISVILRDGFNNRILTDLTTDLNLTLEQLSEDGNPSSGAPDASIISALAFQPSAEYRATLQSTTTIEYVEVRVDYNSQRITQTPTIDIVVPNRWQPGGSGTQRVDWTRDQNWSLGREPTEGDFVIIPDGASDYPDLDLNVNIGSLEIEQGAQLVLFGGNAINVTGEVQVDGTLDIEDNTSLTIGGNFIGSGTFASGESTEITIAGDLSLNTFLARTNNTRVIFDGSTQQTVSTTNLLAQRLEILNDVLSVSGDLIDTFELLITEGNTFELAEGAGITLDNLQNIFGDGELILNDNTLVVRGNLNLLNIDTSEGTVIFGIRLEEDPADYPDLQRQQIANLSQMKNAIINNPEGVRTFEDIIVDGNLTLQNGELIISSGRNFIAPNTNYVNGTLTFRRNINIRGWKMMATPIENSTYAELFDGLVLQGMEGSAYPDRQPNLMWYDETYTDPDDPELTTDNQRWRAPGNVSDPFSTGTGYFFYAFGNVNGDDDYNDTLPKTLTVSGRENFWDSSADFTFPVTYTAEADTGWNMAGNPYGATLDWDSDGWTRENMDNVLYIWDHSAQEYKYWNGHAGSHGSGRIAPFQGFWVKANDENPQLSVSPENKTTGGTFRKTADRYRNVPVLALKLESDFHSTSTHFSFTRDGSFATDPFDAYRLLPFDADTYLEIYSLFNDGTELAVNNLPRDFGKTIEIPVQAGAVYNNRHYNGLVTLTWPEFDNIPEEWSILLVDNHTGDKVNLREADFYDFEIRSQGKEAPQVNTHENFRLLEKSASKARNARFTLQIEPGGDGSEFPDQVTLNQNYPNPFNPSTTIEFGLPVEDRVRIDVFDIIGRRVQTLTDQRYQAGFHEVTFDGSSLASGVYFYRLITSDKVLNKRMTLIK